MKTAIVITGASRGFGRAIAVSSAKAVSAPCHFVLSGTNEEELRHTERLLLQARNEDSPASVDIVVADLGNTSNLGDISTNLFDKLNVPEKFSSVIFYNNAGSLGPLSPVGADVQSLEAVSNAFNINVTAACFLTSELMRRLINKSFAPDLTDATIVNISSLAAIQAFESWGVYCAGKAARDMFHKVLAEEQKKTPARSFIRVLNYAPGPLDTNMQKEIRESPLVDKPTQDVFIQMKENNQLVDPNASSDKLVNLVASRSFETGSHVDFFDI